MVQINVSFHLLACAKALTTYLTNVLPSFISIINFSLMSLPICFPPEDCLAKFTLKTGAHIITCFMIYLVFPQSFNPCKALLAIFTFEGFREVNRLFMIY